MIAALFDSGHGFQPCGPDVRAGPVEFFLGQTHAGKARLFCFQSGCASPSRPAGLSGLYRQIAEKLRSAIAAWEFAVGSRLPAERDLVKQLGVSRPAVCEALIALEVEGWVEIRTGSGVYVLERSSMGHTSAAAPTEWGPLDLIRARHIVEGEISALAAVQAKRKDLAQIGLALQAMSDDADAGRLPLDSDRAFYTAVVQACDNMVLTETIQSFWDSRRARCSCT